MEAGSLVGWYFSDVVLLLSVFAPGFLTVWWFKRNSPRVYAHYLGVDAFSPLFSFVLETLLSLYSGLLLFFLFVGLVLLSGVTGLYPSLNESRALFALASMMENALIAGALLVSFAGKVGVVVAARLGDIHTVSFSRCSEASDGRPCAGPASILAYLKCVVLESGRLAVASAAVAAWTMLVVSVLVAGLFLWAPAIDKESSLLARVYVAPWTANGSSFADVTVINLASVPLVVEHVSSAGCPVGLNSPGLVASSSSLSIKLPAEGCSNAWRVGLASGASSWTCTGEYGLLSCKSTVG